ncbi:MAG: hypothetical protein WB608_13445 [Terracidiphilus sp.]
MRAADAFTRAIELRKSNRYRLSAPVFFCWAPQNGPSRSCNGITRDVNTSAVYVMTDAAPPVGARVQMDILLPKLAQPGPGMHLSGEGIVIRSEPFGTKGASTSNGGFAAAVQFYPEASDLVLSHFNSSERVM